MFQVTCPACGRALTWRDTLIKGHWEERAYERQPALDGYIYRCPDCKTEIPCGQYSNVDQSIYTVKVDD